MSDNQLQKREIIVHDKPTERGVQVNNVLTGLVLAVAVWVGNSVSELKEAVVILATNQDHNTEAMQELKGSMKVNSQRLTTLERLHPEFYGGKRRE